MSPIADRIGRVARGMLIVCLTLSWTGVARAAALPSKDPTAQELRLFADQIDAAGTLLARAVEEIPRESFDPAAVVKRVGTDARALHRWTRENTQWVPYVGVLRGPQGVLMDGTGNSLDRSLLLAALLHASGQTALRLAHATLDKDQVNTVLNNPRVATEPVAEAITAPPTPPAAVVVPGASAAQVQAAEAQLELAATRLSEKAVTRTLDQTRRLSEALRGANVAVQDVGSDPAASADHWWLQIEVNGAWTDLDLASTDGKSLVPPQQTVPLPADGKLVSAIPAELRHGVSVRCIIERWDGSALSQAVVLEHPLASAECTGQIASMRFIPADWPTIDPSDPADEGKLVDAIAKQTEWVPMLLAGGSTILQKGFKSDGEVVEKPNLNPSARVGGGIAKGIGGAAGLLDDLGAPHARPEATKPGALVAAWLEFEVRSPGQPTMKHRRPVFDLLGPAAREKPPAAFEVTPEQALSRGLSMTGQSSLLITGAHLSPQWVAHQTITALVQQRAALSAMLRHGADGRDKQGYEQATKVEPLPGELYGLAATRGQLGRHRAKTFMAQPNVFCQHQKLIRTPDQSFAARVVMDVVENRLAVIPGVEGDRAAIVLEQGVLDTNLETLFLPPAVRSENTSDAYADPERSWKVVKDVADLPASLSPDAVARCRSDLTAGHVVVIAADAGGDRAPASWWRIDPKTGLALGVGESGFGASAAEYLGLVTYLVVGVLTTGGCGGFNAGVSNAKAFLCLGCGIVAGAAAGFLVMEIAAVGLAAGAVGASSAKAALAMLLGGQACNAVSWFGS